MKRFWKIAEAIAEDGGWTLRLDGKPLRTPARKPLLVPTEALAKAIADEWNEAGETVDPRTMPMTGIANGAIDRVAPDPQAFASALAQYGQSDLTCYRAESPRPLVERQGESWDGLLAWARRRFEVDFRTTAGLLHVPQPEATTRQLAHAVGSLDPFQLAALSPIVTIGGSLVVALAVLDGHLPPADAWHAVTIDEQWQRERWSADAEAEAALERRRTDFLAAARFLELLRD